MLSQTVTPRRGFPTHGLGNSNSIPAEVGRSNKEGFSPHGPSHLDSMASLSRMVWRYSRRILRNRFLQVSTFIILAWTLLETIYIHRNLLAVDTTPVSRVNTEKIFIANLSWNNEIIFRTHLINQIRDLVHTLGIPNVYISIYENGSYDGTKDALRDLHRELEALGVRNRITLDETSHEDIVKHRPTEPKEGWIKMEKAGFEGFGILKGDYALRRIHYLAELRNKVLEPLWELADKGEKFDKVLFMNDVVFNSDDILNLLQTRNGQYATACTLDFEAPPAFYDTFALRDHQWFLPLMQTWPFLRSAASRNALLASQPVPVQSCWNGKWNSWHPAIHQPCLLYRVVC